VKNKISDLHIQYRAISELKDNPRNARTHSKHQIHQIAESIRTLGFVNPVLIDHSDTKIAGHGRVDGAKLLGMTEVPTIRLEHLSADQIRAYVIADNRLAETAGWDHSILAIELQHLLTIENDCDITVTGFEIPEIDLVLSSVDETKDPDDALEAVEGQAPVAQRGDLWQLGKHRVFCGDALESKSFSILMGNRRAAVVFVDPPYNVAIDGHAGGNGSIHHREFLMASGEKSEPEFTTFLMTSFRHLSRYSTSGSVHYACMDWRHADQVLAAGKQVYDSLLNLCVWVKNTGGMGSFYRSRHELVFVFRNGKGQHRNNVQARRGR
jgi:ParB-like nuclease domain